MYGDGYRHSCSAKFSIFYKKINRICVAAPSDSRDKANAQRRIVVKSLIIYMKILINLI